MNNEKYSWKFLISVFAQNVISEYDLKMAAIFMANINALQKAMDNTQLMMTNGSTTYLEIIYAQQSLLDAQTIQLNDWLEEAQGVVKLYQALGGGVR